MQTNLSGHFLPVKTHVKKPQKSLHSFGQNFKNKYYHTLAGPFLLKAYKGQNSGGTAVSQTKNAVFSRSQHITAFRTKCWKNRRQLRATSGK